MPGLKFYSTAGYLPDIQKGAVPGKINTEERSYLRELAYTVREITKEEKHNKKRELWLLHNSLKKTMPVLIVFPENSWFEIIPENELKLRDPFFRQIEWYLKHLIYRWENFDDDFVIENEFPIQGIFESSGWGLWPKYRKTEDKGSYVWDPPLKNESDIQKLRKPDVYPDYIKTEQVHEAVKDLLGDIIPVRINWNIAAFTDLIGNLVLLRGLEEVMLDMYDRPEWLHELLGFMTDGILRIIQNVEKEGCLSLNNKNHYTDTGGLGYTRELPGEGYNGNAVRLCDIWGATAAQEFSLVSPAQHDEFAIDYQKKILKGFGLSAYGCCEPLTRKFDIIKKIPNLRRISISPWCDIKTASEQLEDRYVFSWKPNPALLLGDFNEVMIRKYIREMLDITKDNIIEIVMKDTITLKNEPQRLISFIDIAREEFEEL